MASSKKTTKKKSKKKTSRVLSKKIKASLWLSTIGVTILALFLVLQLPPPNAQPPQKNKKVSVAEHEQKAKSPKPNKLTQRPQKSKHNIRSQVISASERDYSYEAKLGNELENKIREIDLALLQAMITSGLGPSKLKHQDVDQRQAQERNYHYQTININIPGNFDGFIAHLRTELEKLVTNAQLEKFSADAPIWEISILGYPTHLLLLNSDSQAPAPRVLAKHKTAHLAIVIDDLGENLAQAQELAQGLNIPVTFSILPYGAYTQEISKLATKNDREILLHLPLEPKEFPEIDPGPGALFVDMTKEQILASLNQNLNRIPKAIGVNNHMGSRFTEDPQSLRPVFKVLKKKNLFFLDSLTTPKSQVKKIASDLDLKYMSRHIFLDNEQNVQAIIYQLQKAERIALSRGSCIAIGHPYPETLTALAKWAKKRNSHVQVCKLSTLL
jgi:polysaccharide deacetylase 2 family uncharacterized protein YibQ